MGPALEGPGGVGVPAQHARHLARGRRRPVRQLVGRALAGLQGAERAPRPRFVRGGATALGNETGRDGGLDGDDADLVARCGGRPDRGLAGLRVVPVGGLGRIVAAGPLFVVFHFAFPPLRTLMARAETRRQTSSSSCSLWVRSRSISVTNSWVSLSSSLSARSTSSTETAPSCSWVSSSWRACRRTLRTATRPSSARSTDHLHELAPAFLVQLRERQPDDLAVVRRVQAEVRGLDCFLDRLDRALVVGVDDERARLGHGDPGDALQGGLGAVVVDFQLLDEDRRGAARADGAELPLGVLDRTDHLLAGIGDRLLDDRVSRHLISVPICSPARAPRMFPGVIRSNTRTGSPLSLQNVIAVRSITRRSREMISMKPTSV